MRHKRHIEAKAKFSQIAESRGRYYIIHYSSEGLASTTTNSPRVTSIAIKDLKEGQVSSFSIHLIADEKGTKLNDIEKNYDAFEREMLTQFYNFVKSNSDIIWISWRMKDVEFGFRHIEQRYKKHTQLEPPSIIDQNKLQLSILFKDYYGNNYTGKPKKAHPRLKRITELNNISDKDWLDGVDEADYFKKRKYRDIHTSTLRKVEIIETLLKRQIDGKLKTKAKWHEKHGFSPSGLFHLWKNTWWCQLLTWSITLIIGGIFGWLL